MKKLLFFILFAIGILLSNTANCQFREKFKGSNYNDDIHGVSFLSPSTGFAAFSISIGFTQDSGKTYAARGVSQGNTNFNGYSVNLTLGFRAESILAFTTDSVIVAGDFTGEPSILFSADGGFTWKLVYHKGFNGSDPYNTMTDMKFPSNGNTGIAINNEEVLRSTDRGQNWYSVSPIPLLARLSFPSTLTGYATGDSTIYKTTNAGASWTLMPHPPFSTIASFNTVSFRTDNFGYVSDESSSKFYKTVDGGNSWAKMNDESISPIVGRDLQFTNDSTGYMGANWLYQIYKTTDSGKIWEPCKKDINYQYLGYGVNRLYFYNSQVGWACGMGEYLLITSNGGTPTMPKAYFKIDTTNLYLTNTVNLINYSKRTYTYKWYKNNALLSTAYSPSYTHLVSQAKDTIELIVSNGIDRDTSIQYMNFFSPKISSFTPTSAATGATVTINGSNFTGASVVSFGGTLASSFTVVSAIKITAVVGAGTSGNVQVTTAYGTATMPGFTYIPPPGITSFSPTSATFGTPVNITGTNFTGATSVTFGGVASTSYVVNSSTSISAIVGNGNSGYVVVTTPGGTASAAGFILLPIINSFSPLNGTNGTLVTIMGSGLTGTTAVSFGGVAATGFTVNSATNITATVGAGSTGDVTVTKPGGNASLPTFTFYSTPTITSFSPLSGNIGTVVTIVGTNFSSTPANNIVYFGAVKAIVTNATPTSLKAIVPTGTTFKPITITTNHLTAYSASPFIVTFPNAGGSITLNSFAAKVDYTALSNTFCVDIADMDGDGKADMTAGNLGTRFVSLWGNTSDSNNISFTPRIDSTCGNGETNSMVTADFDGDGKLDMAITYLDPGSLSIYKNTSSLGAISVSTKKDFVTLPWPQNPVKISAGDIDGDGKPDIITTNAAGSTSASISVFRNNSEPGNISFEIKRDFIGGGGTSNAIIADMDGDGKPDIIVGNTATISFLKNTSTVGNISFNAPIEVATGTNRCIAIGDMDGDGKPDIVSYSTNFILSVFRNTTISGVVSFAPPVNYPIGSTITALSLVDLDGDGKLDISIALYRAQYLSIFKNLSFPGTISLDQIVYFPTGNNPNDISIGDLNGDGKPDIIVSDLLPGNVSIFKNTVPVIFSICSQTSSTTINSNLSGSSWQWQLDTGSGFANVSDNAYYAGTNTRSLQISGIAPSWLGYKFHCIVDGNIGQEFIIKFLDTWTGVVSSAWENPGNWSCGYVPDASTDVVLNSGTIVINSNVTIHSLAIDSSVSISILSANILTILH